jgi:hypothetical protein
MLKFQGKLVPIRTIDAFVAPYLPLYIDLFPTCWLDISELHACNSPITSLVHKG